MAFENKNQINIQFKIGLYWQKPKSVNLFKPTIMAKGKIF